ncbi:MAG: hypothetical protein LJE93_03015 [Acidobacteria bacterium]|jgi:hypothetical protein|nr:hypothetical protein [Acidobacteriota bacterium]
MTADGSTPRPEEFGLTAEFLENEPELIVEQRRGALCAVAVTVLLAVVVAFTAWKTGSLAATLFLAPVLVAAWLVLLLPLVIGCVSLAGRFEKLWRSSCDSTFRDWLRYRQALAESEAGRDVQRSFERQMRWLHADRDQLRTGVLELLGNPRSIEILDRHATGADLLIDDGRRRTVVRCETGSTPAEVGLGRELAMARFDLNADDAILVAPAGAGPLLHRYIEKHPIRVLDAKTLETLERGSHLPDS